MEILSTHSSSDGGPIRMGQLIDTASAHTQDQMGRGSWSTMCQIGLWIESAGIAGRPHSSSVPGPSLPGQLVDPNSVRTR